MTKTRHKRTAVASMFQNGISRNTKCAERDGFRRAGYILIFIPTIIVTLGRFEDFEELNSLAPLGLSRLCWHNFRHNRGSKP